MFACVRCLVCALAVCVALILPGIALAQDQAQPANEAVSAESIERLIERLDDPVERERLRDDLRALLAAQGHVVSEEEAEPRGLGGRLLSGLSAQLEDVDQQLAAAAGAMLAFPAAVLDMAERAQDPEVLAGWGMMVLKIAIILAAAFIAERIALRFLAPARRSLGDRGADNLGLRIFYLFLRTVLDLVPIVAFAAAAYAVLPLVDPDFETRLVAITLVNANVLARVILAFVRMILVPHIPALRLVPMGDEHVAYLYIWSRRVVGLGVYGYFLLEAALLLGMEPAAHALLLRLLGLVITAMAIMLVLQNRGPVAAWLRAERAAADGNGAEGEGGYGEETKGETTEEPPAGEAAESARAAEAERPSRFGRFRRRRAPKPMPPAIGLMRRRFADIWHIVAIVLIAGLYGTWALEVDGGFEFLARAIALTALVLALTGLIVRGLGKGIDRLFRVSAEMKAAFPGLEARANRYLPVLHRGLRIVVYIVAGFAVLQAWGLGTLSWLFSPAGGVIVGDLMVIVIIIALAFLMWEVASAFIERSLARESANAESASTRLLTLLPLLRNVVRVTLVVIAAMIVLSQLGVNIGPLLAGAGVIGLAIGFGAQTLVRDIITGAFILMEDAISVGDWIEAGGHAGTVESLTIRTVTLRDLQGTVHVVPFGDVTSIKNYNRTFGYALIDVGVAYRENYDHVVSVLHEVAEELRADETWGHEILSELQVFGMNALSDSAVEIRVRMMTRPLRQFAVRRAFLQRMKAKFDEKGIEIPFPHRTIYFGIDKDGTAPPVRLHHEGAANQAQSGEASAQHGENVPALEAPAQRSDGGS